MNILLCHNYYARAGGESVAFENEMKGLQQMGHRIVTYERRNAEIADFSAAKRLGLAFSAFWSLRTTGELRRIAERQKPDVAIVQNVFPLLSPSVYRVLAALGIPTIQAVYNYRFVCPSAELFTEGAICERCVGGNTVHALLHRCYRHSYAQSAWYASIIGGHRRLGTFRRDITSFMVPDTFLGTKLVQGGIPPQKIWRNPNPFFVHDYEASSIHDGYVLYVGRLVRQKGVLTLLEAMRLSAPNSRLAIIGDGELGSQIATQIGAPGLEGRVSWLGERWGVDLAKWIRRCAAVVVPSEWYDNSPMVLCAANATGKPVIASRIDGLPEYIQEGVNGYLFEPGDATALARRIDQVLSAPALQYAQLSSTARVFAEENLDYAVHYKNLMNHIERWLVGVHDA